MFKIHAHADSWGKDLLKSASRSEGEDLVANPIKTQFDLYYLFLIIGFLSGKQRPSSPDLKDITRNYPEPYHEYRHVIAGLLLCAELMTGGIPMDKQTVQRKVIELLRSDTTTYLSTDAIDILNAYAVAGFEIIRERLAKPPSEPHEFLIWYYADMVPEALGNGRWSTTPKSA